MCLAASSFLGHGNGLELPPRPYKFEADAEGNVTLLANADGFEHLARYFLKMARTGKRHGYHAHHSLELGKSPEARELTITFYERPQ